MARSPSYTCQSCGAIAHKWSGKCEACGAWNTLAQEQPTAPLPGGKKPHRTKAAPPGLLVPLQGETLPQKRLETGILELDRVAGGGFVPGTCLLIGGDPGIGKSTLLMQAAAALSRKGAPIIYVSGEEAVEQVRLRAHRLGVCDSPLLLTCETNVSRILTTLVQEGAAPALTVVDSIQTLWLEEIEAACGTVSQLRATTEALIRFAKANGTVVLLVGHVTKEGQIAGPRVIEHMVDTVLYFEGERGHPFRILRAVKNRFGPTDEIGVFEMSDHGLNEVPNPSLLFMGEREAHTPGSAVFCGMEGTRPLLMEIQALVSPSTLGTPRRAVVGWDTNRLAMILAVLETRAQIKIGAYDIYLTVAGGLKIKEPGADLAAAAALISSLTGIALPKEAVFFSEIALSGALRPIGQMEHRLKEAAKLGLSKAVTARWPKAPKLPKTLTHHPFETVHDLAQWILQSA